MLNEKNKPFPAYYYLTYIWCIGLDLLCWFFVGVVMYALWGTKRHWTSGCLCIEFKKDSWPMRTWYRKWGGTTLGHTIIYATGRSGKPGIVDTKIERHEFVHVHQFEAMQLLSFIFTIWNVSTGFELVSDWPLLLTYFAGAPIAYLASMIQAWLRGESPYKDNIMEESAYAQNP